MTWRIQLGNDFETGYDGNLELQPLFDFAIQLIRHCDDEDHTPDPRRLPLVITCPGHTDSCMMNLQNTHALIFRIHEQEHRIEFIHCQ